jgi:hypothetical protein
VGEEKLLGVFGHVRKLEEARLHKLPEGLENERKVTPSGSITFVLPCDMREDGCLPEKTRAGPLRAAPRRQP